jgi:hypothetical protein
LVEVLDSIAGDIVGAHPAIHDEIKALAAGLKK